MSDLAALPIVGRGAELKRLHSFLATASAGHGGGLHLIGSPGSGRTRLVGAAIDEAKGRAMEVRSARGRPDERDIAGAVCSELLGDHDLAPPVALDRLIGLAGERALLVTLDDAHVADQPSIDLLTYCARRVLRHPIAILLAGAEPGVMAGPDGTYDGFDAVRLGGLDEPSIAELFRLVAGPVPASVAHQVRELTAGNPLGVLDLARGSSPEQRDGSRPFDDLPLAGDSLVRAFVAALLELPDATRRALCLAAAEPTGRLDVIGRALGRLGDRLDALEAAETAGVFAMVAGSGRFDHPLRRVVAYASLAPASRRAAHRALAHAWGDPGDGEHRLRHLVASAPGPDDTVAADVEVLAAHLERTGRGAAAATAWDHASRLSVSIEDRDRRSARAAALNAEGGSAPARGRLAALTKAELRVARSIAEGRSNRQAADHLYLSAKTVDAHLQAIYRKLDVNNRSALAVLVALHDAGGPS